MTVLLLMSEVRLEEGDFTMQDQARLQLPRLQTSLSASFIPPDSSISAVTQHTENGESRKWLGREGNGRGGRGGGDKEWGLKVRPIEAEAARLQC